MFRTHQDLLGLGILDWPFSMNKQAVRDIIVVGIYVVLFGLNLYLFAQWQKRGKEEATEAAEKPKVSRFGRPLRRTKQPVTVGATNGGIGRRDRVMARTDANPPMPDFATNYELQEVDASYLTGAVKPKQFLHIDQAECILCEGCVDICPWKCIHMVSVSAITDAVNTEQPGEDPATTSRSSSTKTSARGARCASTAARPA